MASAHGVQNVCGGEGHLGRSPSGKREKGGATERQNDEHIGWFLVRGSTGGENWTFYRAEGGGKWGGGT